MAIVSAVGSVTLLSAAPCSPLASLRAAVPLGLPAIPFGRKHVELHRRRLVVRASSSEKPPVAPASGEKLEPEDQLGWERSNEIEKALLTAGVALSPFLLDIQDAHAEGGEFGVLEGRSFALLHPLVMGSLLAYTLYTGYLGWQWRRVREIQNEINTLKKQVKPVAVAAGEKPAAPSSPSPVEAEISKLTEERKELVKGNYRDKHFNAGALLLGGGVFTAVEGCINTYLRTGQLFPGPHLYAGAGITVLWALAAALVPAMQKGNETARSLHIGLNALNVCLFLWQVPTGLEIVGKVFEFTNWP